MTARSMKGWRKARARDAGMRGHAGAEVAIRCGETRGVPRPAAGEHGCRPVEGGAWRTRTPMIDLHTPQKRQEEDLARIFR